MANLYIGLMSGTSADGVDAALVDFSDTQPKLLASHYTPYSKSLREQILALCQPGNDEIHRLGELDVVLANTFVDAVQYLLETSNKNASDIAAIGSHGHTIRHAPTHINRFTLQIGDPNTIAAKTGITTVADFRRKDVALGGQGAPLVPAFHRSLFHSKDVNRGIVNIGGIANITLLPANADWNIIGFDTGPGNTLLDQWIYKHQQQAHDIDGAWGATGTIDEGLLSAMLDDDYFKLDPPKSTGREHFNLHWLKYKIGESSPLMSKVDVQATLAELTATAIVNANKDYLQQGEIVVCGGGIHNKYLMSRIESLSRGMFRVTTTEEYGVHPDWVEAIAFAWLAWQTIEKRTGNLPSVTGASAASILGGVYYA